MTIQTLDQLEDARIAALKNIGDNTFAAACFNDNSIEELEQALSGGADETDMNAWGLSASEWAEQIGLALDALRTQAASDAFDA